MATKSRRKKDELEQERQEDRGILLENVEIYKKKKARDEVETVYFPMFKRTDPMFNPLFHCLTIKLPMKILTGLEMKCLLCSVKTRFETSCCRASLCENCIEDCPPDCVHCHQPLAYVKGYPEAEFPNPQFEGLNPSVSNTDFGIRPLYPECAFIDLHGISFPVFCQDKATVDERLHILNIDEVKMVYFATAGRCPPQYDY